MAFDGVPLRGMAEQVDQHEQRGLGVVGPIDPDLAAVEAPGVGMLDVAEVDAHAVALDPVAHPAKGSGEIAFAHGRATQFKISRCDGSFSSPAARWRRSWSSSGPTRAHETATAWPRSSSTTRWWRARTRR